MTDRHTLVGIALLYLVNAAVGAATAIRENLPAEFAGVLEGQHVPRDFWSGAGTALSPPFTAMAAEALCLGLALIPGRAARLGAAGLAVLGGAFTVGMLGERITYQALRPATFVPKHAAIIAGNLVLPLMLVVFGIRVLRRPMP